MISIEGNIGIYSTLLNLFSLREYPIPSKWTVLWIFKLMNLNLKQTTVFFSKSSLKECILDSLYELRYIDKEEYECTLKWIETLEEPEEYIYVKSTPNQTYRHLIESGKNIDFKLISKIYIKYQTWLKNHNCLIIPFNLLEPNNDMYKQRCMNLIKNIKKRSPSPDWTVVKRYKRKKR